jgi:hypothetical protein
MNPMVITDVTPERVAELVSLCFEQDRLKVVPADVYRQFTQSELSALCVVKALYSLPTVELLDKLNQLIMEVSPERNAIEIGAGNGVIGRGLGIPSTDSFQQESPEVRQHYAMLQQPTIEYGADVMRMDANQAVKVMKPDVVIGAWVTHRHRPEADHLGGNVYGIDEEEILASVKRYIVVGNDHVHCKKPIFGKMTRAIRGDFLFSRSILGAGQNAIYIWDRA